MRYSKEYKTIKKNVNWTFGIKLNSCSWRNKSEVNKKIKTRSLVYFITLLPALITTYLPKFYLVILLLLNFK